jgi:pSer/pThr/pTyr-binding forkhead associated (FHA) protein
MYKLVISDDDGHTTVVPLLRDEVTIGREKGNTIRLTERNVSRAHARILKRNGHYILEDLGSYNGVRVNGARIERQAELAAGDQVAIGNYDLAFSSEAAESAAPLSSLAPNSEPPPRLVVLGEPAAGAEFSLSKSALRIGRDERLDIWINHKSISHEHAELQLRDGKVTVFDLDSANGMRVNGVSASRAILENGDILQLGQVRFRFLPAEGSHSMLPLPEEVAASSATTHPSHKPVLVAGVLALLLAVGAGAVLVTTRAAPAVDAPASHARAEAATSPAKPPAERRQAARAAGSESSGDSDSALIEEPQEWERELGRARKALAKGRFDRAFSIANELPPDSVLRKTPEFGEIRYRYVQSHINDGERALEDGDPEEAQQEAELALGTAGITPKQRQEARSLARRASLAQRRRIVD